MTVSIWERRYHRSGFPDSTWHQYKTGLSSEEANAIVDHKGMIREKAGIKAEFVVLPDDETPFINVRGRY